MKEQIKPENESGGSLSRRDFIKKTALGGGALFLFGNIACIQAIRKKGENDSVYSMILVDYSKCTGCRTCEAVCAATNSRVMVGGESVAGLGNPALSNISVYHYNPDVDVPSVCAMCQDNPCINACPVEPDLKTGRKALYRHPKTNAITYDPGRCVACGNCAEACRMGVIFIDSETGRPRGMCNLCDGDPQCVKHCPYDALSYVTANIEDAFYAVKPEQIAQSLINRWYKDGLSNGMKSKI